MDEVVVNRGRIAAPVLLGAAAGLLVWGGALQTPAGAAGLIAVAAAGACAVIQARRESARTGSQTSVAEPPMDPVQLPVRSPTPDPLADSAEEHRRILASDARCIFWYATVAGRPNWRTQPLDDVDLLDWQMHLLHPEAGTRLFGEDFEPSRYGEYWRYARPAEDQQAYRARFHDAILAGQNRVSQEYRIASPALGELWYAEDMWVSSISPDQWRCVGVCVDITDRKRAEMQSQQSQQRLLETVKASRCFVFEIGVVIPEGAPTDRVDGWEWHWRGTGYDDQMVRELIEVEVPSWSTVYYQAVCAARNRDDNDKMNEALCQAMCAGATAYSNEFRCDDRLGKTHWLLETNYLTRFDDRHWRINGTVVNITAQKQAQLALRQHEQRLQQLMRDARCVVFECDIEGTGDDPATTQFIWGSHTVDEVAAQALCPMEVDGVDSYLNAQWQSRLPEDRERTDRNAEAALRRGDPSYSHEYRVRAKDGRIYWLTETVFLNKTGERSWHAIGTMTDITTRKQAELAAQESERRVHEADARLRQLMRDARCAVFEMEVEALSDTWKEDPFGMMRGINHRIDEETAQALVPVQQRPGESYTEAQWRHRPEEDRRRTDGNMAQALVCGEAAYSQEYRVQGSDGNLYWVSETVFLQRTDERHWRAVGTMTDITARKAAEHNLSEMMRRTNCLIWQARVEPRPDGVDWQTEYLDEEIAQRLLPLEVAEGESYITKAIQSRHPDYWTECHPRNEAAYRSAPSRVTLEYACTDRFGKIHWLQEEISYEPMGAGKVKAVGVCFDITQRKIAEQALHESERRARESEAQVRQLMLQTRCMLFEQNFEGMPGWEHDPHAGGRWFSLPDDLPLDEQAAQNLLPLELPEGEHYSLGVIQQARLLEDRERAYNTFRDAVLRGAASYGQEYRCINRFGQLQWIAETVYLTYRSPLSVHLVGTIQDITARKQSEQDLRSIMAQARCLVWHGYVSVGEDPLNVEAHEWRVLPMDMTAAQQVLELDASEEQYTRAWHYSVLEEDRARRLQAAVDVFTGKTNRIHMECRCRDRHGRIQWLSEDSSLIPEGRNRWRLIGVCVNITARKEAEEAIRQASDRLTRLMIQSRCVLFEADVVQAEGGVYLWEIAPICEDAAQMLVPLDLAQGETYTFNHISGACHPEDQQKKDQAFHEALAAGARSYSHEYRLVNRQGGIQWVSESVYIEDAGPGRWHCVGILADINARKQAEQDLQSIMRQAGCIIFHGSLAVGDDPADVSQYRLRLHVADTLAAQRVVALDVQDAAAYRDAWARSMNPQDLAAKLQRIHQAINDRLGRCVHEFRCTDRCGQEHWISEDMHLDPISPGLYRVVSVCVSITAQKRIEATLSEAKEAAEAARLAAEQANAAKSAFLANMSHEIRTPMTAILGYSDLLQDPSVTPAERDMYIGTIRRNGEHLLAIINDILDLSKIESGRVTCERIACSPKEVVAEVVASLLPKAQARKLALDFRPIGAIPDRMMTDPTRLRQIVTNLVGNAIKFTSQGGVSVVMRHLPREGGGWDLQIKVRDTGIGMTPEQVQRLFQPFQQADNSTTRRFGGTGLGLVISRKLAQLLGGDIAISSQPGMGSTFAVTVDAPLVLQPVLEGHDSDVELPRGVLSGARVLVAEDGPDNRHLLQTYLRRAGCNPEFVADGRAAVDRALEAVSTGKPFHVILMDMQMPVMDGISATAELRSRGYRLPIVALTAHSMDSDRNRCMEAGCDSYVAKPLDLPKFYQTIANHIPR